MFWFSKKTSKKEEKVLEILVKPGSPAGTRTAPFKEEGNVHPNRIPADVVFVFKIKPHPYFTREGYNILLTTKINSQDVEKDVEIPTLEGDKLTMTPFNPITNGFIKKFSGRGLPFLSQPEKRGDLIVKFEIEFKIYPK